MAFTLSAPALASMMHVVGNSMPFHVNLPFGAVGTSTVLPGLMVKVTFGALGRTRPVTVNPAGVTCAC
jgi:hypothetical protein